MYCRYGLLGRLGNGPLPSLSELSVKVLFDQAHVRVACLTSCHFLRKGKPNQVPSPLVGKFCGEFSPTLAAGYKGPESSRNCSTHAFLGSSYLCRCMSQ